MAACVCVFCALALLSSTARLPCRGDCAKRSPLLRKCQRWTPARLKIQGRWWGVLRSAVCLEVLLPHFKSFCFGPRRDLLSSHCLWSWTPGGCASLKSCCFCCVFSILIPLSNSYSVLIPVLIPVLVHGFAGRASFL